MHYIGLVYLEGKMGEARQGEPEARIQQPVGPAATVRVRNGRLSLTDGPFAETREQLAGFVILEARDLNEAVRAMAKRPESRRGSVEVRPLPEAADRNNIFPIHFQSNQPEKRSNP